MICLFPVVFEQAWIERKDDKQAFATDLYKWGVLQDVKIWQKIDASMAWHLGEYLAMGADEVESQIDDDLLTIAAGMVNAHCVDGTEEKCAKFKQMLKG